MTADQVKNAVAEAISSLKLEKPPLEFSAVHERSTAHRLALQLELGGHFEAWNVDCEYDRDEEQHRKKLRGIAECHRKKRTDDVMPDIVVHHRGRKGRKHNLLVVELKRQAVLDPCDDHKLRLFTDPNEHYKYRFGLYISDINSGRFDPIWYKDGNKIETDSRASLHP